MQNHDWIKAVHGVGIILNRYFWEGNAQDQTYTFDDVLGFAVASGLPKNNLDANRYLLENLKEWQSSRYIFITNTDKGGGFAITVANSVFPFIKLYG